VTGLGNVQALAKGLRAKAENTSVELFKQDKHLEGLAAV
jgi:hypothetical protein